MLPSAAASGQKKNKIFRRSFVVLILACVAWPVHALDVDLPGVALAGVPFEATIRGAPPGAPVTLSIAGREHAGIAQADGAVAFDALVLAQSGEYSFRAASAGATATANLRAVPGWLSILPPLLAILMALAMRNVIPALLVGIWLGATILNSFSPAGIFTGLLDSFEVFVVGALADADHAAIVLFSMMIGGMVGIITRNGGMARIVDMFVSRARTARSGQVSVWTMGLMIFFDDYSNTLVVGNTARPLTDKLSISREKLAYIVDSTAAPVACLALVTTWIGYEVGLIDAALKKIPAIDEKPYTVLLSSLPYSFYPIFAILFILAIALSGRDFGPMLAAERRARGGQVSPLDSEELPAMRGDGLEAKPGVRGRAVNAFVPLVVLIVALLAGLYASGSGDNLMDRIGSANAYQAMLWASLLGALTAATLTVTQRILSAQETVDAWYGGVRAMLFAMIVLVLAWALSAVTDALSTADWLVLVLADSLAPPLVPAVVFVISAITAFTTGTSWGTMGILMPLVVPLTWAVMGGAGMQDAAHMHILYSAIACNLAGAVWGDHCSPISDTTVLSSMASGCDHIEHIRTQMPYALLVGTVALVVGTIPGGYGLSPLLSIPLGIAALVFALRFLGRSSAYDGASG